jgi:hypothetical protein
MFRRKLMTFLMGGLAVVTVSVLILFWIGHRNFFYCEIPCGAQQFGVMTDGVRCAFLHWQDHSTELADAQGGWRPPSGAAKYTERRIKKWRSAMSAISPPTVRTWRHEHFVDFRNYLRSRWLRITTGDDDRVPIDQWDRSSEPKSMYYWRTCRIVTTPDWFPILLSGSPLLIWTSLVAFRSVRRVKRTKRGQCLQCGYQLLVDNEYCPECGRLPDRHPRYAAANGHSLTKRTKRFLLGSGLMTFVMGGWALSAAAATSIARLSNAQPVYIELPLETGQIGWFMDSRRWVMSHWANESIDGEDSIPGAGEHFMGMPRDIKWRWMKMENDSGSETSKTWCFQHVVESRSYRRTPLGIFTNMNSVPFEQWNRNAEAENLFSWGIRRSIVTPVWLPGFALAGPVLMWLALVSIRSIRRNFRGNRSRCIDCGYQLIDENDDCPECGLHREIRQADSPQQAGDSSLNHPVDGYDD